MFVRHPMRGVASQSPLFLLSSVICTFLKRVDANVVDAVVTTQEMTTAAGGVPLGPSTFPSQALPGGAPQTPTQSPLDLGALTVAIDEAELVGASADELEILAARRDVLRQDKSIKKSPAAEQAIALEEDEILTMSRAQKPGATNDDVAAAKREVKRDATKLHKLLQHNATAEKAIFEYSEAILQKVAPELTLPTTTAAGVVALGPSTSPSQAPQVGAPDTFVLLFLCSLCVSVACFAVVVCKALSRERKWHRYDNVDVDGCRNASDHSLIDVGRALFEEAVRDEGHLLMDVDSDRHDNQDGHHYPAFPAPVISVEPKSSQPGAAGYNQR